MGLKDAIEKMIQAEREKLKNRDEARKKYQECRRGRFKPMFRLLEELAASVDATYLKVTIDDTEAMVEVGERDGNEAAFPDGPDVRWYIQPNSRPNYDAVGEEKYELIEKPGFTVTETEFPDFTNLTSSRQIFDNEETVITYLIGRISETIAYYRHLHKDRPTSEILQTEGDAVHDEILKRWRRKAGLPDIDAEEER